MIIKHYYIGERIVTTAPNLIPDGVQIFYFYAETNMIAKIEGLEGPFYSLGDLRKKSEIFKNLSKTDTRKAQRIILENNINQVVDVIGVKSNENTTFDFLKLIDHSIRGNSKDHKINGIHHFDENRMKIIRMLNRPDKNLVWRAIVNVEDFYKKKSFEKESSFFPMEWDLTKLFFECKYAVEYRTKKETSEYIYSSTTFSGIPVEIVIVRNEMKSIYPIYLE